jgi:hypothetical protein
MASKITKIEAMARNMVGDGKEPNIYFVSVGGTIVCVTTSREIADAAASSLGWNNKEVLIEDRKHGTVD